MIEAPKHIRQETAYDKNPVDRAMNWFIAHRNQFDMDLALYATRSIEEARKHKERSDYDRIMASLNPEQRMLDEMPICDFWKTWVKAQPIPFGFTLIHGEVLIQNKKLLLPYQSHSRRFHSYLQSTDGGLLIDHCAGQFVAQGCGRGDRIATLASMLNPELLQRNTYGERGNLHMLIATDSALNAIGVVYRDRFRK